MGKKLTTTFGTNFHLENHPRESQDMDKGSLRFCPTCGQMTYSLEVQVHQVEMGLAAATINLLMILMLYTLAADTPKIQD